MAEEEKRKKETKAAGAKGTVRIAEFWTYVFILFFIRI
jgi:hypothetical protein